MFPHLILKLLFLNNHGWLGHPGSQGLGIALKPVQLTKTRGLKGVTVGTQHARPEAQPLWNQTPESAQVWLQLCSQLHRECNEPDHQVLGKVLVAEHRVQLHAGTGMQPKVEFVPQMPGGAQK